jgi:hypothetical protein
LIGTTPDNEAHCRGRLMRSQSRNGRPSSTACFQGPTSDSFHKAHPAAHCTSSYPEDPSRLGLRKTFLNCLDHSPAKIFLGFSRQRASILLWHARHTNTSTSICHLYYAPISKHYLRPKNNFGSPIGWNSFRSVVVQWFRLDEL